MRLVPIVVALAAACSGPGLHVDNPRGHTVFVDGVASRARTVPYRYYGTIAVDALPAAREPGKPDWSHRPTRTLVPIEAPASGWLFPLDFPLELIDRLLQGRRDATVAIAVDAMPPGGHERLGADLDGIRTRADTARTSR